uniref:L-seryl-tRNA(Sec) kinase n=1 Tax=Trichuris muris TaxID=70415 RepID=A0A5S6Q9E5_TRIMR
MGCRLAIVVLIGLPGAGKTFLCRRIIDIFEMDDGIGKVDVMHVCYDDIIQDWKNQHDVRREILECVRSFCNSAAAIRLLERPVTVSDSTWRHFEITARLRVSANSRIIILIDDNMHLRSMRHSFYLLAREREVGFGQIAILADVAVTVRQNALRRDGVRVDEDVIFNMAEKMQLPDASRFHWERNTLLLNGLIGQTEFQLIRSFLIQCFSEACIPSAKVETPVRTTNKDSLSNVFYRCDIALRRIVAEEVGNASRILMDKTADTSTNVHSLAKQLSEAKLILLKRFKQSGFSQMPTVDELKKMLFDVHHQLMLDQVSDAVTAASNFPFVRLQYGNVSSVLRS